MATVTLPLVFRKNHLYVKIAEELWVYDTGCQISFGDSRPTPLSNSPIVREIQVCDKTANAEIISGYLGVKIAGLIGTDILNQFNHLIDLRPGKMELQCGTELTPPAGRKQPLHLQNQAPAIEATVDGKPGKYIFDTGAQLSYLTEKPPTDRVPCTPTDDFWIPIGEFPTETYHAPISLKGYTPTIRLGYPPEKLQKFLSAIAADGIIGNELLIGRLTGYFPQSNSLILQA